MLSETGISMPVHSSIGIPYIDADTAELERGFVTVGVPVGSDEFVQQHLRGKWFYVAQWRLAWQLGGMAARHFHQAQRVLSGCLGKRFIYLAHKCEPSPECTMDGRI
jgi:hypothetical protein